MSGNITFADINTLSFVVSKYTYKVREKKELYESINIKKLQSM